MTAQIANAINGVLQPDGVAVIIEAEHYCMTTRDVSKPDVSMTTRKMQGAFRDDARVRAEFFTNVAMGKDFKGPPTKAAGIIVAFLGCVLAHLSEMKISSDSSGRLARRYVLRRGPLGGAANMKGVGMLSGKGVWAEGPRKGSPP